MNRAHSSFFCKECCQTNETEDGTATNGSKEDNNSGKIVERIDKRGKKGDDEKRSRSLPTEEERSRPKTEERRRDFENERGPKKDEIEKARSADQEAKPTEGVESERNDKKKRDGGSADKRNININNQNIIINMKSEVFHLFPL